MKSPATFSASLRDVWHRHRTTIVLLFLLSIIAGSSRYFLPAQLLEHRVGGENASSSVPEPNALRVCSSKGTVFERMNSLQEVMDTFRRRVSEVVAEREQFLRTPSRWQCLPGDDGETAAERSAKSGESEPPMDKLRALAEGLPGWHFPSALPFAIGNQSAPTMRPVTFASFASIVGEFERAYRCKLTEFQDSAFVRVARNNDRLGPQKFCCNTEKTCVQATSATAVETARGSAVACSGPVTSDSLCGGACPILISQQEFADRLGGYYPLQLVEQERARTAVERTISALRSFEMNEAYARQLTCFQRASLDLKNELSLLADATSCLPRIWDAVTSLHDRTIDVTAPSLPPQGERPSEGGVRREKRLKFQDDKQ